MFITSTLKRSNMNQILHRIYEFLIGALSMLLIVLAPIKSVLFSVSALVVADFITGIWAAAKRKERISSNGINKSIMKSLAYMLLIIVSFIMETYLMEGVPVVKVVSGMIALREGKSFFENMHAVTGINLMDGLLVKFQQATAKEIPRMDSPVDTPTEETAPEAPKKKKSAKKGRKKPKKSKKK